MFKIEFEKQADKQAVINGICQAHHYRAELTDDNGEQVSNPESMEDFAYRKIDEMLQNYGNKYKQDQDEQEVRKRMPELKKVKVKRRAKDTKGGRR